MGGVGRVKPNSDIVTRIFLRLYKIVTGIIILGQREKILPSNNVTEFFPAQLFFGTEKGLKGDIL